MRRVLAVVGVIGLLVPVNALAFDTFWHSACSGGVAQHYGFTADATNLLQFATFSPDFFGPAYDRVFVQIEKLAKTFGAEMPNMRRAGSGMHFDNLAGTLDANWKFDYLFSRLASNTANTIASFYADSTNNDAARRILVADTLGASLHMVQDFYSHSDWVHFDFVGLGFPQQKSEWGADYAPSWFQVRAVLGSPPTDTPETWPIQVNSGIYPPPTKAALGNFKVPISHTNMNHDNSQLFYEGESQIKYHAYGAHPAHDDKSAADHQLYAVSSAAVASVEWIKILENANPGVTDAINDLRGWKIGAYNPAMLDHLTKGLEMALATSCFANKWDGDKPPPARHNECLGGNLGGAVGTYNALLGLLNEFWQPYFTNHILERLTTGIIDPATGKYTFDINWMRQHRVPPPGTSAVKLANGLTCDAPSGATASGSSSSVSITGTDLGSVTIDVSSPQSANQAGNPSPAPTPPPGQPPFTPDPPVMPPPDWMLGNGGMLVSQRTINGHTYRCSAQGLSAAQYQKVRVACRSLRAS